MSHLLPFIWKKTWGTLGIHLWSGLHNRFQVYVRLLVSERSIPSQTPPTRSFALCGTSLVSDIFCREVNRPLPEHCRFRWCLPRHGRPFDTASAAVPGGEMLSPWCPGSQPTYHRALLMACVADEARARAPNLCTHRDPMPVTATSSRAQEGDREPQYQEKV